jgi:hypothetical protein
MSEFQQITSLEGMLSVSFTPILRLPIQSFGKQVFVASVMSLHVV